MNSRQLSASSPAPRTLPTTQAVNCSSPPRWRASPCGMPSRAAWYVADVPALRGPLQPSRYPHRLHPPTLDSPYSSLHSRPLPACLVLFHFLPVTSHDTQVRQLSPVAVNTGRSTGASGSVAELTVLCCAPGGTTIASGYSDGSVSRCRGWQRG